MQTSDKSLQELIQELPPDKLEEVKNFVQFLLTKRTQKQKNKLRQNWAGSLEEFREEFTALELQKKSLSWRGD